MASVDGSHSAEFVQNPRRCADDSSSGTHSHSQTSSDSIERGRLKANQKKTKFVVRKIPSFVTEDVIQGHLEEFRDDFTWFFWTQQPDVPNPTRRQKTRFQRFYIRFRSFEAAKPFVEKFQRLTFKEEEEEKKESAKSWMDQYQKQKVAQKVCVEFAPNQTVPVEIGTRDRRINTIDDDEDYKAFVQGLADQEAEIRELRRSVEASSKRTEVMDMRQTAMSNGKSHKADDATNPNKPRDYDESKPIAPLAKHVATLRHRRKILAKKISRASLVKSERAKERNLERARERRRLKRVALANSKHKKYRTTHWIAKHAAEDYDEGPSSRKRGGRGSRFPASSTSGRGKKGKKKRRFKVNPKYLKKYADQHDDAATSPRSPRAKEDRVRDPEAYDARDRRNWAMKRRSRGGGSKRRGRGKAERVRSERSVRGKGKSRRGRGRKRKNGFKGAEEHEPAAAESFDGYSRKRGHQKWQRAR